MARLRRPPTPEEIQDWFRTVSLDAATMLHGLVGADLKKRQPQAAKPPRKRVPKATEDIAEVAGK